ncbi:hypothetical protein COCVIDRAFT_111650 [Bipolaris victoriae FI3]|uniref:Uncharacterized protein n=2 Tax=Bipolaris TaxID=33194 RepID=W6YHX9_COCC2|nr:uncharacterized protein COCCADRAFT_102569 [Bipolaris zeicola 26-R-13]XP_014551935.1 hypothetical protein COCVIDRAFT_111650 [Bipolaris victoriae FI3]EUC30926.1 hypothetical protein COCCADRAFT_102569 [Bipolaris zeicola 26-R-13]
MYWAHPQYTTLHVHYTQMPQYEAFLLCSARYALPPTPAFVARLPALPLRYHH